jgi:hypothetical protein
MVAAPEQASRRVEPFRSGCLSVFGAEAWNLCLPYDRLNDVITGKLGRLHQRFTALSVRALDTQTTDSRVKEWQ